MKKEQRPLPTLADIEREVLAQCREWGRQRLQQRLQQLADQTGEVSPLRQRKRRPLTLRTELGLVPLTIDYGQDPHTQEWFCPQQRAWGFLPHQKITPGLAEKLCFTALAIMLDGWMVRHRGVDWGLKPAHVPGERVAWQECKSAVIYRLEQAAQTAGGRGLLVEKFIVAYASELLEFGRRVQAEARRRGLGKVARVYVVADGGVWIWNIVADRFAQATGVLDFYPASQHLWAVAHTLHPQNEGEARAWVEPLLHRLRHGGEEGVRQTLQDLPAWCQQRGQLLPPTVEKEIHYFSKSSCARAVRGAGGGRLSGGQRSDGIVVRATARPFQTRRPVLDRAGTATLDGLGSRAPQPRLG